MAYNNQKQAGFIAGPVLDELGIQTTPDEDGCPVLDMSLPGDVDKSPCGTAP